MAVKDSRVVVPKRNTCLDCDFIVASGLVDCEYGKVVRYKCFLSGGRVLSCMTACQRFVVRQSRP
jgi:hypothetical protein